jgi:uncharacterized OB-fold protein
MKVLRLICVDCGLIRHPMAKGCPRCASAVATATKVEAK